jgi:hypothetical protein
MAGDAPAERREAKRVGIAQSLGGERPARRLQHRPRLAPLARRSAEPHPDHPDELPLEPLRTAVAELKRRRAEGEALFGMRLILCKSTFGRNRMHPYYNYKPTHS